MIDWWTVKTSKKPLIFWNKEWDRQDSSSHTELLAVEGRMTFTPRRRHHPADIWQMSNGFVQLVHILYLTSAHFGM